MSIKVARRMFAYLSPTYFLMKNTAPALEILAVSPLPLNTETQPEGSKSILPNRGGRSVVFEKFSVFALRSLHLSSWRIGWFSNRFLVGALVLTLGAQMLAVYWPPLQVLLRTVPIWPDEWTFIPIFVLLILIVPDLYNSLRARDAKQ